MGRKAKPDSQRTTINNPRRAQGPRDKPGVPVSDWDKNPDVLSDIAAAKESLKQTGLDLNPRCPRCGQEMALNSFKNGTCRRCGWSENTELVIMRPKCPKCSGVNTSIKTTLPWNNGIKVRYHQCECGVRFKSTEHDDNPKELEA